MVAAGELLLFRYPKRCSYCVDVILSYMFGPGKLCILYVLLVRGLAWGLKSIKVSNPRIRSVSVHSRVSSFHPNHITLDYNITNRPSIKTEL